MKFNNRKEQIEKLTGVFVILKDMGVAKIRVDYSGGGDSGAIDAVVFEDSKENDISIDEELIPDYDQDKIESIAYDYINGIEDWWNNEGGYGSFYIDLNTMEYNIVNNINITDVEVYEHGGDLLED